MSFPEPAVRRCLNRSLVNCSKDSQGKTNKTNFIKSLAKTKPIGYSETQLRERSIEPLAMCVHKADIFTLVRGFYIAKKYNKIP